MKSLRKYFPWVLTLFFGSGVCAATDFQTACRTAVATQLTALEKQGYQNIGSQKIAALKRKTQKTQWRLLPIFLGASGGGRLSASHLTEENSVLVSSLVFEHSHVEDMALNALVLHEALAAAGIDDEDYSISLSALLLGYLREEFVMSPETLEHLESRLGAAQTLPGNRHYANYNSTLDSLNDGGTSVGGGGDLAALDLKLSLLRRRQLLEGKLSLAAVREILALNIYVDYASLQLEVYSVKFDFLPTSWNISHQWWVDTPGPRRDAYRQEVWTRIEESLF